MQQFRVSSWRIKEITHQGGLRYHKEKRAVDWRAEVTGVVIRETVGAEPPEGEVARRQEAGTRAAD